MKIHIYYQFSESGRGSPPEGKSPDDRQKLIADVQKSLLESKQKLLPKSFELRKNGDITGRRSGKVYVNVDIPSFQKGDRYIDEIGQESETFSDKYNVYLYKQTFIQGTGTNRRTTYEEMIVFKGATLKDFRYDRNSDMYLSNRKYYETTGDLINEEEGRNRYNSRSIVLNERNINSFVGSALLRIDKNGRLYAMDGKDNIPQPPVKIVSLHEYWRSTDEVFDNAGLQFTLVGTNGKEYIYTPDTKQWEVYVHDKNNPEVTSKGRRPIRKLWAE